uniref:(northern house mosquito) hypothetical protein n=1 Tax=Culex pipiens TaxID=7175 RepID=A0A8D8NSP1_CULPI
MDVRLPSVLASRRTTTLALLPWTFCTAPPSTPASTPFVRLTSWELHILRLACVLLPARTSSPKPRAICLTSSCSIWKMLLVCVVMCSKISPSCRRRNSTVHCTTLRRTREPTFTWSVVCSPLEIRRCESTGLSTEFRLRLVIASARRTSSTTLLLICSVCMLPIPVCTLARPVTLWVKL